MSDDSPRIFLWTAVAHGKQQLDNQAFEERRRGRKNTIQKFFPEYRFDLFYRTAKKFIRSLCLQFFTPEQLRAQASGYPTHLLQDRLDELLARIGSDPEPITVDDLKRGLVAVELTERESGALIALWQLPSYAGTAEEVAAQAGFSDSIEANCIGVIGNKLAKFFDRVKPGDEEPGYLFIAEGVLENGVLVWYLLEDVCQAIEQLGWVESVLAPEAKEYG